jgi:excinuclease ABC subunit A
MNKPIDFAQLSTDEYIIIKGAKVHNLKNVDVAIHRNCFNVITGLSGSGKSSLAFDTLYAEGQRRYVESLSSYARQFLGKFDKPDVEYIKGISPAIAIEQKVNTRNPRSTVGTSTEIYDYLKLLFARIGKTFSPISGLEVKSESITDIIAFIVSLPNDTKVMLGASINQKEENSENALKTLIAQGFSRILIKDEIHEIADVLAAKALPKKIELLIDRFKADTENDDNQSRIADSIQTALYEGQGQCFILFEQNGKYKRKDFSNLFELDGMSFERPSPHFFTFNNPVGACKKCEGFGSVIGIDPELVIPNKNLSVFGDAIVSWKGEVMGEWKEQLIKNAHKFDFPVHRSIKELSADEKELLWTGNKYFSGLNEFFKYLETQTYKIQYRVMLSRYRGKTICPDCHGTRLRKDASYVKINEKSISELVLMPLDKLAVFFKDLKLNKHDSKIAERLLIEINNRLNYLLDVGLGYLTLNRLSSTLSGGESQRINLATSLGSSLVGSIYILDEPSIGLHPRDTNRLIKVLQTLKQLGNTLVVVEHEEEIMQAADYIIDMGPAAGTFGGEIIFHGNHKELALANNSLTAKYLNGIEKIEVPGKRLSWKKHLEILGARENNIKNVDVKFPLEVITVVTGVSGSGKSSLVNKVLYPAVKKVLEGYAENSGQYDELKGDVSAIQQIEFIDQNPIGKSSRSNPVTYIKAYDDIRNLYTALPLAKARNLKPAAFSFNVDGGRCDECKGEGEIKVEMQFMPDITLKCESCGGKKFKEDILEINYRDKNIDDILCMTIADAISFFEEDKNNTHVKKILEKLSPLKEVGLDYVQLGQSSSTLSGGEAQRIKLATFLSKGAGIGSNKVLFIFDEPTTGLHFHDIKKLLHSFNRLIENGHSIIIIEHNAEVIKCADWVIDLGPEGGELGGNIVFEGTPEELVKCKKSYTGQYLKSKMLTAFY